MRNICYVLLLLLEGSFVRFINVYWCHAGELRWLQPGLVTASVHADILCERPLVPVLNFMNQFLLPPHTKVHKV
jgi:hypothetical protein